MSPATESILAQMYLVSHDNLKSSNPQILTLSVYLSRDSVYCNPSVDTTVLSHLATTDVYPLTALCILSTRYNSYQAEKKLISVIVSISMNACEVAVAVPSDLNDFYAEIRAQLLCEFLRIGEKWYLIDQRWWCRFLSAVQSQETDNHSFQSDSILNASIVDAQLSSTARSIVILKPLLVRDALVGIGA